MSRNGASEHLVQNKIHVEQLTMEAFRPFGAFANMLRPDGVKIGDAPITFYRDMLQISSSSETVSLSVCEVRPRPFVIDTHEYHSRTGEGAMPLNNDVLIHVAPATAGQAGPHAEQIRVFRVPLGTMFVLRPGVWHHAPFALNGSAAHILTILPERTYANDCYVVQLPSDQMIAIEN